ncbi:YbaB/EbfC family DNA-binding protein [Actinomadura soli]|uniref:YbaB/EbfC family DNA-binding protein n=1 Tax=Actinomadura soli TaxID=2508997 RepID=A0A5C4J9U8_9ACTN|nr:YbaB/EbfC family nucleoid-associated protein [Actinomadura soli]TMQ94240.1 YbaB/EbfC family DNA-binding protein [Actinomadura soli]
MTEPSPENAEDRLVKARERLKSMRTAAHSGSSENGLGHPPEGSFQRGVGTADEERVKATATKGRLTSLELDPRAMRQSPEELAAHIAAAANAALDDLRAQTESTDTEPTVDPAALVQTLRNVQEQGMRQMALINQSIGEALAKARASIR